MWIVLGGVLRDSIRLLKKSGFPVVYESKETGSATSLGAVTREILYVRGYLGGGLNLDLRIYDLVLDFLQER